MFTPNFNNAFFRLNAVHVDALGIDPLRDKLIEKICDIDVYTLYEVKPDERGAPDLVSANVYGGADHFWWHILAYNGICSYKDIVGGLTLRIPDMAKLISLTTDNSLKLDGSASIGIVKI